jgi:hypothetical protein
MTTLDILVTKYLILSGFWIIYWASKFTINCAPANIKNLSIVLAPFAPLFVYFMYFMIFVW